MGLDTYLPVHDTTDTPTPQATPSTTTPGASPSGGGEPALTATTASMQSLLAQYFETQHFTPALNDNARHDAQRPHGLNSLQSETRVVKSGQSPAATSLPPAAFVPMPVTPMATVTPLAGHEWPASARSLIEALRQENDRLRHQLLQQAAQLHSAQDLADSDVLTPTLNRRAFLREATRAIADCKRYGEDACLIYLDMDGFKGINDAYGHAAGDAALIHVAETLKASVREGDSVGRMGGDEFAVLLRRADLKSSRVKAMKLEAELALGTFQHNGLYLKAGGSFGVRAYAAQATAEAWLSEADAAMFLAKKASR